MLHGWQALHRRRIDSGWRPILTPFVGSADTFCEEEINPANNQGKAKSTPPPLDSRSIPSRETTLLPKDLHRERARDNFLDSRCTQHVGNPHAPYRDLVRIPV